VQQYAEQCTRAGQGGQNHEHFPPVEPCAGTVECASVHQAGLYRSLSTLALRANSGLSGWRPHGDLLLVDGAPAGWKAPKRWSLLCGETHREVCGSSSQKCSTELVDAARQLSTQGRKREGRGPRGSTSCAGGFPCLLLAYCASRALARAMAWRRDKPPAGSPPRRTRAPPGRAHLALGALPMWAEGMADPNAVGLLNATWEARRWREPRVRLGVQTSISLFETMGSVK